MTTILNSGIERILRLYYSHKEESFHLREISRNINLSGRGLVQYLNILEKEKILYSKKRGNLKMYTILPTKRTFAFFTLLDLEKERAISQRVRDAVSRYISALTEQPVFAILFGSTAKGTATEDSDVDILLVTNSRIKTKGAEKDADVLYAVKVSSFQIDYKDFLIELKLKNDPVIQSALKTGFPLINHILYYEVLYNERV